MLDRGHRRQHARLDERDQGRHRLSGARGSAARRRNGRRDSRAPDPVARARRPRRWSRSSTGSRSTRYLHARADAAARGRREVHALAAEKTTARRSRSRASDTGRALVREARRLGLVQAQASGCSSSAASPRGASTRRHRLTLDERGRRASARPRRRGRSAASPCAVPSAGPRSPSRRRSTTTGTPVPDAVLAHLPAPRRGDLPARGRRRRRAMDACRGRRSASSRASLARAQAEQRALRPELPVGIGGATRTGSLKCLHAHAAFALARPGYELGDRILAELPRSGPRSLLHCLSIGALDIELARQQWSDGAAASKRRRGRPRRATRRLARGRRSWSSTRCAGASGSRSRSTSSRAPTAGRTTGCSICSTTPTRTARRRRAPATVADAAFHRYARGASDYRP